jgi:hypothetical protein
MAVGFSVALSPNVGSRPRAPAMQREEYKKEGRAILQLHCDNNAPRSVPIGALSSIEEDEKGIFVGSKLVYFCKNSLNLRSSRFH